MKGNYDKAIQIGDTVGGGAFAKYLFNTQDINYLANLSESTQESRIGELSTLKKVYENLPDTEKARYEEGEVGDVVKEQYNREVDELKVKNGLVNTNNMGDATANTLAGLGVIDEGSIIYCTDGDSGSKCIAIYDGSNWKRISLGANISSS